MSTMRFGDIPQCYREKLNLHYQEADSNTAVKDSAESENESAAENSVIEESVIVEQEVSEENQFGDNELIEENEQVEKNVEIEESVESEADIEVQSCRHGNCAPPPPQRPGCRHGNCAPPPPQRPGCRHGNCAPPPQRPGCRHGNCPPPPPPHHPYPQYPFHPCPMGAFCPRGNNFMTPMPYFRTYPGSLRFQQETEDMMDIDRLAQNYPETARQIQMLVDEQADRMDYDGSMMFDESPDKVMTDRIVNDLYDRLMRENEQNRADQSKQNASCELCTNPANEQLLKELILVLLYQEMYKRRCKNRRCNRWW